MKIEFGLTDLAGLVRDVAGVAAHIERGMTAAFGGDVNALLVAAQAKILFLIAGRRLQQLILVIRDYADRGT